MIHAARDHEGAEFCVVIVDDRVSNRTIYTQLTETSHRNVSVQAFGDAFQALHWLTENAVDLVITDFKMPGLDGAEFVSSIRQRPLNEDVPVVVITAYADRDLPLRALEAGATDFLHSPVNAHEFQTRVRNLIKLGRQQRLVRTRAAELSMELSESVATRQRIMRESRQLLAQVIDTVSALISAVDRNGDVVFANAYYAALAGTTPDAVTEASQAGRGHVFGAEHHQRGLLLNRRVFELGAALPSYEEEVQDRNGRRRVMLTTKAPLHDGDGQVMSVLTTSLDITARKQAEDRLKHLSECDGLTNLPNRACLYAAINRALAEGRRGDRSFALHFVDLDHFKLVNDGLGHHMGDLLLQDVSARLVSAVGEDGMVARIGGDEFAILQTDSPSTEGVAAFAARVIEALDQPFRVEGTTVHAAASVGIAMYPSDGRTCADLLKSADLAMYRAKAEGRRRYRFTGDDEMARERQATTMVSELRQALPRKQLVLHYQPLIERSSGRIVAVEALLRWFRPGWGLLSPAAFLPAAEQSGLVAPISEWVFHEGCRQASAWWGSGAAPFRLAINLSPLQAREPSLAFAILGALEAAGLPPSLLTLEVTEDTLAECGAPLAGSLSTLREAGVSVAIDNFGLGRLSLASLQGVPVDSLKIDQTIIQTIDTDAGAAATVRDTLRLGRLLALDVAAIGVETEPQAELLRELGCDLVQGYLFGRPLPADAFEALLTQGPAAARPNLPFT